jgi:hypothetical protein
MKIKELISEDAGASTSSAGSIAGVSGSLFGVPLKRNMPRKRPKKEQAELGQRKEKHNVLEAGHEDHE